jgi:Zn-dependent protease
MQTTAVSATYILQTPPFIFALIVLIFSIIIHEISHGYVADMLGDPTARLAGRLTLNPLKHIDPIGSIVVPIITSLAGFTFGWAKPVPFNPFNLKHRRSGELIIALAGPASNLFIAFVFGLFIRFGGSSGSNFSAIFLQLCAYIVLINVALAIFNLVPIPPLDGSKIIFVFFPSNQKWMRIRAMIEHYSIWLVLIIVIFLWQFIVPIIPIVFKFFTGVSF